MSTEMSEHRARAYRKRRRAEMEAATRERITEATVELHGTIGPARTTVSAIAERAGVQRATVYRHFPDQASLFVACTQHWRDRNPAPDLSAGPRSVRPRNASGSPWRALRLVRAHRADGRAGPAGRRGAARPCGPPSSRCRATSRRRSTCCCRGGGSAAPRRRRLRAAIGHAVAFETWRSLVRRQGLSDAEAVDLMATLVGDRVTTHRAPPQRPGG